MKGSMENSTIASDKNSEREHDRSITNKPRYSFDANNSNINSNEQTQLLNKKERTSSERINDNDGIQKYDIEGDKEQREVSPLSTEQPQQILRPTRFACALVYLFWIFVGVLLILMFVRVVLYALYITASHHSKEVKTIQNHFENNTILQVSRTASKRTPSAPGAA